MTRAWLMMGAGFLLFSAGFPAMVNFSHYWWCSAFYVAGLAMIIIGRRHHDLVAMAQAGQERRTPELEHPFDAPETGAGLSQSHQPWQPNPAPGTGRNRRKRAQVIAWVGTAFAVLLVLAGLRLAEQGVLPEVLDSGTSARATVVKCVPSEYRGIHGYRCDAKWSVGGTTHTGPLYPLAKWSGGWTGIHKDPPAVGSQLDVRVRGDRAYEPANLALDASFIAGGLAVIAGGAVLFWYLRRKNTRR